MTWLADFPTNLAVDPRNSLITSTGGPPAAEDLKKRDRRKSTNFRAHGYRPRCRARCHYRHCPQWVPAQYRDAMPAESNGGGLPKRVYFAVLAFSLRRIGVHVPQRATTGQLQARRHVQDRLQCRYQLLLCLAGRIWRHVRAVIRRSATDTSLQRARRLDGRRDPHWRRHDSRGGGAHSNECTE